MEYTHVGRLGLVVSRLCLGTMNFGPHTSEPDSHAIMDAAVANGINFFDTANVYGRHLGVGATEEIIGRWFARGGGRRDKVVLATKVYGTMGDWPNEGRLSKLAIIHECEQSLRRLRHAEAGAHRQGGRRPPGWDLRVPVLDRGEDGSTRPEPAPARALQRLQRACGDRRGSRARSRAGPDLARLGRVLPGVRAR